MKKSQIYKYVLVATMKELLSDEACGDVDSADVFEVVNTLCDRICIELLNERMEIAANNKQGGAE